MTIRNRTLSPATVTPLKKGEELAAASAIKSNGADDVIFKVGDDYFQASGRGMDLGKVKANDVVTIGGKEGRVVHVDQQLNTFWEGAKSKIGLFTGGGIAAYGLFGYVQGVMAGANMAGLGLIIAAGGVAIGVGINLVPALIGHFRKVDTTK
jgi:hypothetical protein